MQAEIASGKELEDVADVASHEADTEGITGLMYGVDESAEGTVNPAILIVAVN